MKTVRKFQQSFLKVGKLYVYENEGKILALAFEKNLDETERHLAKWGFEIFIEQETKLHRDTWRQLGEYFDRKRDQFDLPVKLTGTDFQKKSWKYLLKIPHGENRSYRDQAESVATKKHVRAVARANSQNPIAILIPCHRVISSTGDLSGYNGGIDKKKYLLGVEGL